MHTVVAHVIGCRSQARLVRDADAPVSPPACHDQCYSAGQSNCMQLVVLRLAHCVPDLPMRAMRRHGWV
jgi:hypothetical protein